MTAQFTCLWKCGIGYLMLCETFKLLLFKGCQPN